MELTEKMLSTETIYEGRIISVTKDVVLLENGNQALREVVKHSGGVCVCALTDRNEVLMVRQYRYPHSRVLLEIPAGKLEQGESHCDCGKRELLEETGYTARSFEYMGCLLPTPAYCGEVIHIYLARELEAAEQRLDEDEFLEVVKIPFEKAVEMVMNGEITDGKTQLALLKAKLMLNM